MGFLRPPKQILLNDDGLYPIRFTLAGAVSTPAAADTMTIRGYGSFKLADVVNSDFGASRPIPEAKQVASIAANVANQITFIAPAIATEQRIIIEVEGGDYDAEYAQDQLNYGKRLAYFIKITPNDTAVTALEKIYQAIDSYNTNERHRTPIVTVALANQGAANSTVTFTGRNGAIRFKISAIDNEGFTSDIFTTLDLNITTAAREGRNDSKYIKENVRLLTEVTTRPYSINNNQLAVNGGVYSSLTFSTLTARPDLAVGDVVSGQANSLNRFNIYMLETPSTKALVAGITLDGNGIITAGHIAGILTFLSRGAADTTGALTTTGDVAAAGASNAARIDAYLA